MPRRPQRNKQKRDRAKARGRKTRRAQQREEEAKSRALHGTVAYPHHALAALRQRYGVERDVAWLRELTADAAYMQQAGNLGKRGALVRLGHVDREGTIFRVDLGADGTAYMIWSRTGWRVKTFVGPDHWQVQQYEEGKRVR